MLMEFRASNEVRNFFCCNDKKENQQTIFLSTKVQPANHRQEIPML